MYLMPAKLESLVKQIRRNNPAYSDSQVYATAWSVFCRYAEPGSPHCRRPPSTYFAGEPTFAVPAAVRREVWRGLKIRESVAESSRCCTDAGLTTAHMLTSGAPFPISRLVKMNAYFARHAVDNRGNWPDESKGFQAWLLWGGDAGRRWAARVLQG
jgi:hypothetical protein